MPTTSAVLEDNKLAVNMLTKRKHELEEEHRQLKQRCTVVQFELTQCTKAVLSLQQPVAIKPDTSPQQSPPEVSHTSGADTTTNTEVLEVLQSISDEKEPGGATSAAVVAAAAVGSSAVSPIIPIIQPSHTQNKIVRKKSGLPRASKGEADNALQEAITQCIHMMTKNKMMALDSK